MADLALRDWHHERDANWRSVLGSEIPWSYPHEEFDELSRPADAEALRLVDRSAAGRLELVGADRVRFLNGLVTCDVARLEEGQQTYGFVTDGKGRILADVLVLALADRLWLELPGVVVDAVRSHIEKYVVADRVEVRPLGDFVQLALVGPSLPEWWAGEFEFDLWGSEGVGPSVGKVRLGGTELFVHRHAGLGLPAAQFWVSSGIASPIATDLCSQTGCVLAGERFSEWARITAGVARFGVDFDQQNLPAEAAIDGSIDFQKGCYLGQEIVARLHYRGQAARQLRRLRWTADQTSDVLAALEAGSRSLRDAAAGDSVVGEITSYAVDLEGCLQALAMVRRQALESAALVLAETQLPPGSLAGPAAAMRT